jgi:Rod binding domain-containing protein
MLQPMFDTVNTAKGTFGGGAGEEAWKPMMVQEFAKQMAAHGGLGLAKPVYDAMLRMQEANKK